MSSETTIKNSSYQYIRVSKNASPPRSSSITVSQWRRLIKIAAVLVITTLLLLHLGFFQSPLTAKNNKPRLEITSSTYKIMQITDLHLGEAEDTEWGPEQDKKTWRVLDSVISGEQPDLLILSGDQLTANNCDKNATAYYTQLGDFLSNYNTPYAMLFGNHDDMAYEKRDPKNSSNIIDRIPAKTSRKQLAKLDSSFALSLTQVGDSRLFGTSNYVLPIFAKSTSDGETSTLAAQVVMLDSGGGSLPQQLEASQVEWFLQQCSKAPVPALVFQHIPTQEFLYQDSICKGFNGDDGIDAVDTDSGMMQALYEDENVWFLAVGHNHGNDYCCEVESSGSQSSSHLHVCFGRHSGYGGYGTWDRGARVYQLDMEDSKVVRWKSWVRMESGEVVDEYDPYERNKESSSVNGGRT